MFMKANPRLQLVLGSICRYIKSNRSAKPSLISFSSMFLVYLLGMFLIIRVVRPSMIIFSGSIFNLECKLYSAWVSLVLLLLEGSFQLKVILVYYPDWLWLKDLNFNFSFWFIKETELFVVVFIDPVNFYEGLTILSFLFSKSLWS